MVTFYAIISFLNAIVVIYDNPLWFELLISFGVVVACISRQIYLRRKRRKEDEEWWAKVEEKVVEVNP